MKTVNTVYVQLETHLFKEGADGFKCSVCGKGRSQHEHDGFKPQKIPHSVSMNPEASYKGFRVSDRRIFGRYRTWFYR